MPIKILRNKIEKNVFGQENLRVFYSLYKS